MDFRIAKQRILDTSYKRKEKFYNPIWQNSGHIKEMRHFLGDPFHDLPICSIVVFGKQATLKFKEPFYHVKVIKINELLSVIQNETAENKISASDRNNIHQLLSSAYIKDKKEKKDQKKKHVTTIKQNIKSKIIKFPRIFVLDVVANWSREKVNMENLKVVVIIRSVGLLLNLRFIK